MMSCTLAPLQSCRRRVNVLLSPPTFNYRRDTLLVLRVRARFTSC